MIKAVDLDMSSSADASILCMSGCFSNTAIHVIKSTNTSTAFMLAPVIKAKSILFNIAGLKDPASKANDASLFVIRKGLHAPMHLKDSATNR